MINKDFTPVKIRAKIHMNLSDRMYLAVARKDITDKLIYVYTLGCPGGRNETFYLTPNIDIATFNSPKAAENYTNTIGQIMHMQSKWPVYSMFQKAAEDKLNTFNEMTK